MHENMGEEEPSLQAIVSKLAPCDLVLIEGYKRESHRKVELRRSGGHDGPPLSEDDPSIGARGSDHLANDERLPVFHIDKIEEIADFVVELMEL